MTRILLLSDTHNYLDENIQSYTNACDEIWHAGDFGSSSIADKLAESGKPVRGVYGNIDGADIRKTYPLQLTFTCEGITVLMQHIGGYPGKYAPGIKEAMNKIKPGIFISGHSHILKVMFDEQNQCLHMNPGACGKQGWHSVRTMLRFVIDKKDIRDCEVIELPGR